MPYKLDEIKILVVEDLLPMLTLTKSILQIFGFKKIIGARNSEEAFRMFCEEDPDIVITDWFMTPYDGLELIQKIRKDEESPNPYVPIILMSGYTDKRRVEEGRDNGMTEFLMKPYTSRDLYKKIVMLIERPRQFVKAKEYFGPDRRRKIEEYIGPVRRMKDLYNQRGDNRGHSAGDIVMVPKKDGAKDITSKD